MFGRECIPYISIATVTFISCLTLLVIQLYLHCAIYLCSATLFTLKEGTIIITYACDNREKLVWSLFKRKLSAHFGSYHRVGTHDDGWDLYTCRSPLDDTDRSTAVLDASLTV